jgi:hypothetical protein
MIRATRKFPAELLCRVSDSIPAFCRSARVWENDDGTAQASAHENEIARVRRAVRLCCEEAAANESLARAIARSSWITS